MRTALVTHTWLDDPTYFDRTVRWVKHHRAVYPDLHFYGIDNGSTFESVCRLLTAIAPIPFVYDTLQPNIMRDGLLGYGYTWRAFYAFAGLLEMYDRVIFMESDFFICSARLRDWTLEQSGLVTVACPKYGFPESALMILTRECAEYERFVAEMPWEARVGALIETTLPFTHVDNSFIGDRYEDGAPPRGIDFAAQVKLEDAVSWSS